MDTDVLETLYTVISRALCEEEGHKWRHVQAKEQPDAAAGGWVTNTANWETCIRCGKTRMEADSLNADTSTNTQVVNLGGGDDGS